MKSTELRERLYFIGLPIITISFLACVISFYLLLFGIPSFLIGVVLVFLSNRPIKTKLLTTITPIVLYIPLTFIFLYLYNYSTPKTILIPENFDGDLRIVYEEKCGSNYKEIDGIKTLTFPQNGILVLNEDFDRHVNFKYYLVDKLGNRTEIPQILDFDDRIKKRRCVLVRGAGTIGETVEFNSTNEEKAITFSDFYVYNKDTTDTNDFKTEQKFDSLTRKIVNECKQRKKGFR